MANRVIGITAGSPAAFAVMVTPAAICGVSRSARLRCQQRLKQMLQALGAAHSKEIPAPTMEAESQPALVHGV